MQGKMAASGRGLVARGLGLWWIIQFAELSGEETGLRANLERRLGLGQIGKRV